MIKTLRSSIFAGIAIGTAGFGFLASGVQAQTYGSLVGAVMFSFGLLTVVGYKLRLYTGTAGFIKKNEVGTLFLILLGNIIGCFCASLLSRVTPMEIQGFLTTYNYHPVSNFSAFVFLGLLRNIQAGLKTIVLFGGWF